MRSVHNQVRSGIFKLLDIFYPLFRRFMPLQTYHYAACGGSNTVLSFLIYSTFNNFVFKKPYIHIGMLALKSYNAALFVAFLITFPIGFYLSMYVTFHGSYLKRRVQFARYVLVIIGCLIINYIFLQIFVQGLKMNETIAQIPTTAIVILFNYFSQRHFSFRAGKPSVEGIENR